MIKKTTPHDVIVIRLMDIMRNITVHANVDTRKLQYCVRDTPIQVDQNFIR